MSLHVVGELGDRRDEFLYKSAENAISTCLHVDLSVGIPLPSYR